METQRSSVLLYGVLGILVVSALYVRLSPSNDPESNWLQNVLPSEDSTTSLEFNRRSDSSLQQSALRIRDQQIAQLRNQIDQKNEDLSNAMQELNKKTLEFASLQTKLKESQKFVDELLGQSLKSGSSTTSGRNRSANTAGAGTGNPDDANSEQPDTIESLRARLQTIQEQMTAVQEAAEADLDDAEDALQAFQSSSADVLVDIGAPAVPGLIESLSDDESRVRAWAAYVLGRIGEDASDAVSALTTALSDPDETVQEYAQEALEAIN
ncbi:MAG: HEAT repeat domain-containing protein [Planctomycetes bacterium]|nr:HEAT repeat domain-containing protein [Planctomycetota bacterium]